MTSVLPETLANGRFQLLEVIGEGGMATVWRAFDQRLQRPRAVKLLSPAYAQRPSLRRRFLAEAQTMATLEEARVVRVFDMGEDGDRVYIVMELVEGGSLLDRVRDHGRLPPRLAATVVRQIAEATQTAHDHKVIHRDIKPHNILLTRAGDIRITDFGIAQVKTEDGDGLTRTGAMMGTWGYMAPEQKANAKSVDVRADVYALGATLWAVLKDDTPPELFMSDQEAEMLADIPFPLAEVIFKATRYRREERYATAMDLAAALREAEAQLPTDPDETPPLYVPRPEKVADSLAGDTMMQFQELGAGTMVPAAAAAQEEPEPEPEPPRPPPAPPLSRPDRGDSSLGTLGPVDSPPPSRAWIPVAAGAVVVVGLLAAVGIGAAVALWPKAPEEATAPVAEAPVAPPVEARVETPPPAEPSAEPTPKPERVEKPKAEAPKATPDAPPAEAPPAEAPPAEAPPAESPKAEASGLSASAPSSAAAGSSVTVRARAPSGYKPTLYYRTHGQGAYQTKVMSGAGGEYSASVKVDAAGLDWFVSAEQNGKKLSAGSAMSPKRVEAR